MTAIQPKANVIPGTPLPWEVQTPMGEDSPWIVQAGKESYEWEPVATLGDCLEDLPASVRRRVAKDAAFIVHAVNCHSDLVEALEECAAALAEVEMVFGQHIAWTNARDKARAILSLTSLERGNG